MWDVLLDLLYKKVQGDGNGKNNKLRTRYLHIQ